MCVFYGVSAVQDGEGDGRKERHERNERNGVEKLDGWTGDWS